MSDAFLYSSAVSTVAAMVMYGAARARVIEVLSSDSVSQIRAAAVSAYVGRFVLALRLQCSAIGGLALVLGVVGIESAGFATFAMVVAAIASLLSRPVVNLIVEREFAGEPEVRAVQGTMADSRVTPIRILRRGITAGVGSGFVVLAASVSSRLVVGAPLTERHLAVLTIGCIAASAVWLARLWVV